MPTVQAESYDLGLIVALVWFVVSSVGIVWQVKFYKPKGQVFRFRISIFYLVAGAITAVTVAYFVTHIMRGDTAFWSHTTLICVATLVFFSVGQSAFAFEALEKKEGWFLWPLPKAKNEIVINYAVPVLFLITGSLLYEGWYWLGGGFFLLYVLFLNWTLESKEPEDPNALRFANKNLEHGAAYIDLEGDVNQRGMFQTGGIYIGRFAAGEVLWPMYYNGNQHIVLCAPTRAGKGVGFIIPNLLTYEGSAIVVDPKGQNAAVTARRRREMGQTVHILNPFGLHGLQGSHINPLDVLLDAGDNLAADTDLLADALVYSSEGTNALHFDSCARDLLSAIMMHVVTAPQFAGRRTLHTVRQLAASAENDFAALVDDMLKSPHAGGAIANKVSRFQKPTNETASIRSTLINQTRLLDISQITEAMTGTDFSFNDLKKSKTTVYLILPANRLDTCNRWLRLMITLALQSITNVQGKPEKPVLFLLDEMPVLGRFAELKRAAEFNAGFGVQLFMVVQNLTQLQQTYGRPGWETFMANAGIKIFMRTADVTTTNYFAQLIGETTVTRTSESTSRSTGSNGQGGASTTTTTGTSTQRSAAPVIRKEVMQSLRKEYAAVVYDGITWSCAPPYYDPRCHCVPRGSFDPDPEQVPVGSRPVPPAPAAPPVLPSPLLPKPSAPPSAKPTNSGDAQNGHLPDPEQVPVGNRPVSPAPAPAAPPVLSSPPLPKPSAPISAEPTNSGDAQNGHLIVAIIRPTWEYVIVKLANGRLAQIDNVPLEKMDSLLNQDVRLLKAIYETKNPVFNLVRYK